jgi:hypothetical protein
MISVIVFMPIFALQFEALFYVMESAICYHQPFNKLL